MKKKCQRVNLAVEHTVLAAGENAVHVTVLLIHHRRHLKKPKTHRPTVLFQPKKKRTQRRKQT